MLKTLNSVNRLIALMLTFSILIMTVGCSETPPTPTLSGANPQTFTEKIEVENIITETVLHEFITTEVYLQEFIIAEDRITELLLEENMIDEVTMCKTIYVPQENIDEFSANSQTAQIFGDGVDITSVLRKIAIGTGVIVTLAIVKKIGVPTPIASLVVAAADESLKFAKSGAVVGTVFGAFTGAADEIDEAGRVAALAGFALATVGMIVSIVSLVGAIPSAGTTSFGVVEGVHLAWAGVKVLLATAGMVYTTKDVITAFTSTDASDIDWDNIDWEKVGVSAAQKSIENGADGYMWGAVYGAIDSTVESYYHKYSTPYTKYTERLNQVPKDGNKGKWSGKRGESDFILNEPIELPNGTNITKVTYKNAIPDFSPFQEAQVKIPNMTNIRSQNFSQADKVLAEYWTEIKHGGTTWTARDVETYRTSNNLTWHEMSNMEYMQLVPREVNQIFTHFGGVAEYNAMTGQEGGD